MKQSQALVVGNSVSRSNIDLLKLSQFEIYGCNALYRDFAPNHLIITDLPMIKEMMNTDYHSNHKVYTTPSVNQTLDRELITLPNQTDELCPSGIRAIKLAVLKHSEIYMIGLDFTDDNIYSDTPTYGNHWDFTKWIKEIEHVISRHKHTNFYRIGALKRNIAPYSNFKELNVSEFINKFYHH